MEQNDVIKRLIADNKEDMTYVTDSDGIVKAMSEGKIASLIGVESGHAINSNMGILRMLYEMGTRYMTLTHGCNTPWYDLITNLRMHFFACSECEGWNMTC